MTINELTGLFTRGREGVVYLTYKQSAWLWDVITREIPDWHGGSVYADHHTITQAWPHAKRAQDRTMLVLTPNQIDK